MSNQPHVVIQDLATSWRRLKDLSLMLEQRCNQANIGYAHRTPKEFRNKQADKVLLVWQFDGFNYEIFQQVTGYFERLGKKVYILTDNWLDETKFQARNAKVFPRVALNGLFALTQRHDRVAQPRKLFNCFIHRTESVRQSWFYFLWLRGLLDQGYVSYRLYQINESLQGQQLFDNIHHQYLSAVDHFNQAHQHLRDLVPFRNFQDVDDLAPLILDSKYSLVLDTYATDDNQGWHFVSEKAYRALQFPTESLLFVQHGALVKLQQEGLLIEPDLLEIDNLPWIQRQQSLLEILQNDSRRSEQKRLHEQSYHNQKVLETWLDQCTKIDFYDDIFDYIATD